MGKMKLTKAEKSWILYDIANSAFILLVSTTIPIYFRALAEENGASATHATAFFGTATSISVLILAVLAPILGAIADYRHLKKRSFIFFLALGIIGFLCLCVTNNWIVFLLLFILSRIGYSACNIYYDAMLIDVTTDERMDMLSSYGFAFGYIGSCIPFIIGIVLVLVKPFGLSAMDATKISFLITALWWIVMSLPLLKNVHQNYYQESRPDFISHSFKRLGKTFVKLKNDKKLLYYIIGYFFYIDGVYTIISMATTYGGEVGIDSTAMILALLLTQFVAFPCAIISGKLAGKYGTLKLIKLFIIMYAVICVFGFQLDKTWEFWVLAVAVGMCQGGIQSLSRSHFGKMIPKDESSEYFGFFDIFGKFADFFGPLILSVCAFLFHSSSYGVLALIILFIIGFLCITKSEKYIGE